MRNKTTLAKKTIKTFLITGAILAIFSCIALYFFTKQLLESEIEEELYSTETRVREAIKRGGKAINLSPIIEVQSVNFIKPEILKDTLIYDPSQNEIELFRELSTYRKINQKYYHITIRTLVVESTGILVAIVISNIAIFTLAFIFLFYFNTAHNLNIWRPFYEIMDQIKTFSVAQQSQSIRVSESDVIEFSELQNQILMLTSKVRIDYENLKQFTENVSHEIQTPLAIIQAKIDNIINDSDITEHQFEQIASIQKHIQRLKQLIKKIITLTKIENNQFINSDIINFNELISEQISNYKELDITTIVFSSDEQLNVVMDPVLADILINNLLSNAIRYSTSKDEIRIITRTYRLSIENPGNESIKQPEKLFTRFYREGSNAQSSGLGLAIVRKICEQYSFSYDYNFVPTKDDKVGKHVFSIFFRN